MRPLKASIGYTSYYLDDKPLDAPAADAVKMRRLCPTHRLVRGFNALLAKCILDQRQHQERFAWTTNPSLA